MFFLPLSFVGLQNGPSIFVLPQSVASSGNLRMQLSATAGPVCIDRSRSRGLVPACWWQADDRAPKASRLHFNPFVFVLLSVGRQQRVWPSKDPSSHSSFFSVWADNKERGRLKTPRPTLSVSLALSLSLCLSLSLTLCLCLSVCVSVCDCLSVTVSFRVSVSLCVRARARARACVCVCVCVTALACLLVCV